jgi:tetratricopeptide (TPR) repeat protein
MKTTEFKKLSIQIIEASQAELAALEIRDDLPASLEFYRKVLLAAQSGDIKELESLLAQIRTENSWKSDFPCLETLTELRLCFLKGKHEQVSRIEIPKTDFWRGEFLLLQAASFEKLERFTDAIAHYKQASKGFASSGIKGKALRARFNAVTLLSHLDPSKNLVRDYFFLYREARKLKQFTVMATALLNISREYQRIGANKMALKFANKTIACASADMGGLIYFMAVAHRAHVLRELGRATEAKIDLEEAKTAPFPEVQAAVSVLERMFESQAQIQEGALSRSWQERLAALSVDGAHPAKLSETEEKLLEFVSRAPQNKFDIMEHLFGKKMDPFVAENRLKNLIFRLRRKAPGLLIFDGDRYFLSDQDLPPRKRVG